MLCSGKQYMSNTEPHDENTDSVTTLVEKGIKLYSTHLHKHQRRLSSAWTTVDRESQLCASLLGVLDGDFLEAMRGVARWHRTLQHVMCSLAADQIISTIENHSSYVRRGVHKLLVHRQQNPLVHPNLVRTLTGLGRYFPVAVFYHGCKRLAQCCVPRSPVKWSDAVEDALRLIFERSSVEKNTLIQLQRVERKIQKRVCRLLRCNEKDVESSCSICMEPLFSTSITQGIVKLNCEHMYHEACFAQYVHTCRHVRKVRSRCPLCAQRPWEAVVIYDVYPMEKEVFSGTSVC